MKQQASTYTADHNMRETTREMDFFFLQNAFLIVDPDVIFANMLDRFDLVDWLQGRQRDHYLYEEAQAYWMAEEFLGLVVALLSEPADPCDWSMEDRIKREIIQNLALGRATYSDLVGPRRVSRSLSEHQSFDRILLEVANFQAPKGAFDTGYYDLKPKHLRDVDPYFFRFQRNQREECEKFVLENLQKKGQSDPVVVPKAFPRPQGSFECFPEVYKSEALIQIVHSAISRGRESNVWQAESLVDLAVQLVMLCLVNQPEHFAQRAIQSNLGYGLDNYPTSLVALLSKVYEEEKAQASVGSRWKIIKSKIRWCLQRIAEVVGPEAVPGISIVADGAKPRKSAKDSAKAAAKARNAAIMRQFEKAQQNFLDVNKDLDEVDEEEDMDEDGNGDEHLEPCIVCHQVLEPSQPFGSLAYVQSSNLIRSLPHKGAFLVEVLQVPLDLDRSADAIRPFGVAGERKSPFPDRSPEDGLSQGFPSQEVQTGLFASTCGHMMHVACFETYKRNIRRRHESQPNREHPENVQANEYICPLCKAMGNVLLPLHRLNAPQHDVRTMEQWMVNACDFPSQGLPMETISTFKAMSAGGELRPWFIQQQVPQVNEQALLGVVSKSDRDMLNSLMQVTWALSRDNYEQQPNVAPYLPQELIAYTLACTEVAMRGQAHDVSRPDTLPELSGRLIRSLLGAMDQLVLLGAGLPAGRDLAAFVVTQALVWGESHPSRKSSVSRDPLVALVEAAAICPQSFGHFLNVLFYAELIRNYRQVQSIVTLNRASSQTFETMGRVSDEEDDPELNELSSIGSYNTEAISPEPPTRLPLKLVARMVYALTLPFLRRASLLHTAVYGSQPPKPIGGRPHSTSPTPNSELFRLIEHLGIVHPRYVFGSQASDSDKTAALIRLQMRRHDPAVDGRKIVRLLTSRTLQSPGIYELVGLPQRLNALLDVALHATCVTCHRPSKDPAMCLICGAFSCFQSYSCTLPTDNREGTEEQMSGPLLRHTWRYVLGFSLTRMALAQPFSPRCSYPVGMFLLIRQGVVLYLYDKKGSFYAMPYVDAHGEVDIGMR